MNEEMKKAHLNYEHPEYVEGCELCEARKTGEGELAEDLDAVVREEVSLQDKFGN